MSLKIERDTWKQTGNVPVGSVPVGSVPVGSPTPSVAGALVPFGPPPNAFQQQQYQPAGMIPHGIPPQAMPSNGLPHNLPLNGLPGGSHQMPGVPASMMPPAPSVASFASEASSQFEQSHVPGKFDQGRIPGTTGRHPIAEAVGTVITGGRLNAGTKGYLSAYIRQLESNPMRTKMLTAGTLSGLQELMASWLAKDRNKHGNYFTSRVPKMAAYGALVSAPLGHVLIWCLQKTFQGRTSLRAKILQILVSNLIIAPIQNSVYLVAMALIAGARTEHQVRATVRVGFWKVMQVSWVSSPLCLAFAQQFLPEQAWLPFFNLVSFAIGTWINTVTKKKRLAALRKKHFGDGGQPGMGPPRSSAGLPPPSQASGQQGGRPDDYSHSHSQMGQNPAY